MAPAAPPQYPLYKVYRGTGPYFTPSSENLLATVSSPGYIDPTAGGDNSHHYYVITAVNTADNRVRALKSSWQICTASGSWHELGLATSCADIHRHPGCHRRSTDWCV